MAPPAKKRRKELVPEVSSKYGRINPSKNFLSEPMLNYILKNSSQKAYYKLIQVSKYFLANQPPQIKTFENLYHPGDWFPSDPDPYEVSEITGNRLWIKAKYFTWKCSTVPVKSFLQRCFRVDISWLELFKQRLTYDELNLLMERGGIIGLNFNQCKITHSNGEEVDIEDILKMIPLLEYLTYKPCEKFTFSSQNVADLPNFYCLDSIELRCITEEFSCKAFRSFLKKAPITSGRFKFDNVSPEYLRKFQLAVFNGVNPTIKVKCSNNTIFFGDFVEYDMHELYDSDGST